MQLCLVVLIDQGGVHSSDAFEEVHIKGSMTDSKQVVLCVKERLHRLDDY